MKILYSLPGIVPFEVNFKILYEGKVKFYELCDILLHSSTQKFENVFTTIKTSHICLEIGYKSQC